MILAGTPPTTAYGGMFFVTTTPAPNTAPSPIMTPSNTVTLAPIKTSLPILIGIFSTKIFSCTKLYLFVLQ